MNKKKDVFDLGDVDYLRELELFNQLMKEMSSTSSSGGAFNTPQAFTKSGEMENDEDDFKYYKKVKAKKRNSNTPNKDVSIMESKFIKKMKEDLGLIQENVDFGGYISREDLSPEQKIGKTIKSTKKVCEMLEKELKRTVKLKTENGMSNENFWKSTKKDLNEMTIAILSITRMIRDLSS